MVGRATNFQCVYVIFVETYVNISGLYKTTLQKTPTPPEGQERVPQFEYLLRGREAHFRRAYAISAEP
jgi:hypothetical protein